MITYFFKAGELREGKKKTTEATLYNYFVVLVFCYCASGTKCFSFELHVLFKTFFAIRTIDKLKAEEQARKIRETSKGH